LTESIKTLGTRFNSHVDRITNVKFVVILLQCPLLMEPDHHEAFSLIMQGILKMDPAILKQLKSILTNTPREYLSSFINIFHQFITVQLYSRGYIDEKIAYATRLLGIIGMFSKGFC